jgi:hypothetical protein
MYPTLRAGNLSVRHTKGDFMGCDIHSFAERKNQEGTYSEIKGIKPFDWRCYGTFAFLAGVRNYSDITPISEPRGIPDDISETVKSDFIKWDCDVHTPSWLSVKELEEFDYDSEIEDCMCMRNNNGGSTCKKGEGKKQTYREFLGKSFFNDIEKLKEANVERVVFWFDN